MHQDEKAIFDLLKEKIAETMKRQYPGINPDISEWKGQEITDFQEDLMQKVKAQVSEKWFYTHIKTGNHHLPRIDVLNMLSQYAGYHNWNDFRHRNGYVAEVAGEISKSNRLFLLVPALVVVILAILYGLFMLINTREYRFSFYDAETAQPIADMNIEVNILNQGESPTTYLCDSMGRFRFKTDKSEIRMVVTSPYYHTDTIHRILKKFNTAEKIGLHASEYALMLHYFTRMKVTDWKKRQQQLDSIIDRDALIYQVHGKRNPLGVELLNKQEFINFLSVPSGSLRSFEILEIQNRDQKIKVLRYRINSETP